MLKVYNITVLHTNVSHGRLLDLILWDGCFFLNGLVDIYDYDSDPTPNIKVFVYKQDYEHIFFLLESIF